MLKKQVELPSTFCFLLHNFDSRYARKPIKGCKNSDASLVSQKNLSPIIGSLDWRLGPGKVGKKRKNTPTCDVPP